jgi:hypothetical protein
MAASEQKNLHRIKGKDRRVRLNLKNRKKLSKKMIHRILRPIKRRKILPIKWM